MRMEYEAINYPWATPMSQPATFDRFFSRKSGGAGVLVFLGYYLGARLGFAFTFKPHPVSVLWPPNSILLAALLLTPPRVWWFLLLWAFPAHCLIELQSDVPFRMVSCWFLSNSFEALLGATCVHYLIRGPVRLDRLRNVAVVCLAGVFLGPFLSSFLDASFVVLNQWGADSYWEVWRIRFSSNALAAVMITPLIVAWAGEGMTLRRSASWARLLEAGCLLLISIVTSYFLFIRLSPASDPALLYAPLPLLLWAAIRFGMRGATSVVAIIAFLAIWGTAHNSGPFAEGSAETSAHYVQVFLIFMSLPLLFLAALMEERSKTSETLQEREERISLAAETADLTLWTVDFNTGESWINDKGRELFDFEPDEKLSKEGFLSKVHPDDKEKVWNAIERAQTGDGHFDIEYRLRRKNGDVRWLISRGRYLQNHCNGTCELLGVAIDITRQVTATLELRLQQQELARLSRVTVMGELTASIAHELNQPLTAISSNAAAGKRFLLAPGPVDRELFQELLDDVFVDARRAAAVIHGIRQFVRKGHESRSSLNLNEVIAEVLRLLRSDLLGRSVQVETNLESDLPLALADPIQMQQVLMNLVVNSLEAMQGLSPERHRIEISSQKSDNLVQVSVRDFGSGLPENPEKIFAHFFSTKPEGMGMGLAIARSIVEAHGGELWADKLPDGARLSFSVPMESKPQLVASQS